MKYYKNIRQISYDAVSALLIIIAVMIFAASPVSVSVSAGGAVSFSKTALADEITANAHASANSAANSVVGLLGIYRQSFAKPSDSDAVEGTKIELSKMNSPMNSLVGIDFDEDLDISEASGDPDN